MTNDYKIIRFQEAHTRQWDEFVASAKNSSFLFMRGFMNYHACRFRDCSWLAFKKNKLVALLPANLDNEGILHSHQGLTYGGWILPPAHIDGTDLLYIFEAAIRQWRELGIKALDYKPLPHIYASSPSQEDIYALFRLGAEISEVNLSMAIDLENLRNIARMKGVSFNDAVTSGYNKLRRRALAKTDASSFHIHESCNASEMISLVSNCLQERHNAHPVHSAEELQLLHDRFPENIHFHYLRYNDELQAAVCIFDTGTVAHAQYIATTPLARELNLLTPLFHHLICDTYASRRYFDFGTSNENHGLVLNNGLLRQKASFGAGGVAYMRYRLSL